MTIKEGKQINLVGNVCCGFETDEMGLKYDPKQKRKYLSSQRHHIPVGAKDYFDSVFPLVVDRKAQAWLAVKDVEDLKDPSKAIQIEQPKKLNKKQRRRLKRENMSV